MVAEIPYMVWAKAQGRAGEYPLTQSAVPPVDWSDIGVNPAELPLFDFTPYGPDSIFTALSSKYGVATDRIFWGTSTTHAHFCLAASRVESGDVVLFEVPGYSCLVDSLRFLGVQCVPYVRRPDTGFRVDLDRLETLVRSTGARLILLTEPHNPTGTRLTEAEVGGLVELVDRFDVELLVDEMYRPFIHPEPPTLALRHDRILAVAGPNKVHGLSALRVGWGFAPPERVREARAILDATTVHNPAIVDEIFMRAFPSLARLERRARNLRERAYAVLEARVAQLGWDLVLPDAGIVCYPRVPPGYSDGDHYRSHALRVGVNLTPGRFFGLKDHVRVGFGLTPDRLERALDQLETIAAPPA